MKVRASAVVFGLFAAMVVVSVGVPASAAQTVDVLVPLVPARILDTRSALGAGGPVGPNGLISVDVTGVGGVPASGVGAVVLNVTAAEATSDTWLTVFPHGQARPETSNLNVTAGFVAANTVVATVGDGGLVDLYNFAGSVELIVDVTAWLPSGGGYTGFAPQRVLDTRVGGQPVGPNGSIEVQLAGRAGVPASGVGAVVLSVTSTQATADTFLTVWPSDQVRADTSNLNPLAGRDASNAVVARLSADGRISVFNSAGSTHVIVDVFGWLPIGVGFTGLNPARILDTRSGVGLASPVGAASTLSLDVTGVGGVPSSGVGAVVLNLTATQASEATFVTAWPSGLPRPIASSLNPAPGGVSVANLVVAAVGSDGNVSLYNDVGSIHLIADVVGWFAAPSSGTTNQSPVGVDDAASTDEDSAVTVDVLANDTDADGDVLVVSAVGAPSAGGSVVITGGGSAVSFNPGADFHDLAAGASRPTSFTYTVSDGVTADTATVTVTVTGVADDPTAVADAATVAEGAAATAIDVLANDTDPDGGPTTIQSATDPANGTVAITGGGTGVTYQPDLGYCNDPPGTAPDTFTYTLNGGSTATVTMTVSCFDDAPTAVDDAATVVEDSGANAIDVLANDTDPDAGPKTVTSTTDPANGTVVITGGGTGLTYQPDLNYCNDPPGTTPDTFTYTLNGGSVATVSVTVTCVPDDPTAVNDAAIVVEDSVATAIDVLANDTDPDGGPKAVSSTTDPANGTVVIAGAGAGLTYQPDANYCNDPPGTTPDTFTYTINGGSTATVSVTVTCGDDPPTAVGDTATVPEDSAATPIAVLANDTDIDAGPLTIASASDPTNGTVVLTGGSPGAHTGLTYQPDPDYCNDPPGTTPDTFTYTLNGGSVGTVAVTVTCGDDPPTAVDDTATVPEDSAATPIAVLANDTDIDAGPMTIASASDPTNGTVALTGGSPGAHTGLTYQPDLNYCNDPPGTTPDTFTYTINGGSVATVSVTVTCGDDAPVAVADAATVIEDAAATAIAVLGNDTDIDGGPMTIASASDPANGTVVLTGGSPGAHTGLTYQPDLNYCNDPPGTSPDTFTYTLNGGSVATVFVAVTCVPDPATLVNSAGPLAYTENDPATAVDAAVAITNPDGLSVTDGSVSITTGFQIGQDVLDWVDNNVADGITEGASTAQTVVLTGSGTAAQYAAALAAVTYVNTSENPSTATRTVTFAITAGAAASDTIQITVTAVDDAPVAVNDAATVVEDAAATAVTVLTNDTDVDAGPKTIQSAGDPANGTVIITGGGTGLTYQPDANYCNNPPGTTPDTFTYTLNGGSIATVAITVTCVNDAPNAGADSFDTIGNTELRVDLAAGTTPTVTEATGSANGVRGNDTDPAENDPFTVTSIVGCADVAAPYDCPVAGGTVSMTADGDFSFVPSPTLATGAPTDTTFQYVITDQPTAGTPATATGTVTIHVFDKVWYVRQGASGNGTSTSPLGSFTGIAAGDASDSDAPGDYIFVHNSGALTSSIVLEANQHLLGEGVGLSINRNLNANGAPTDLVAAGVRPAITSATNTVGITAAIPIEIRGLSLASNGGNAIDLTSAGSLSGSASLIISDNTVTGATLEGVDINLNAGTTGTLNLAVSDNTLSATGTALDITRNAGTLTITAFHDNTVSASSAAGGIAVTGTGGVVTFDQTPGGGIDPVPGGTTVIGASGDRIGGAGLVLSNVAGNLNLANAAAGTVGAGDLDVFSDSDAALNITGGAGGFTFNVTDNAGSLVSNAGPAALITTAAVDLDLALLTSNASTAQGVSLTTVTGSFSAPSGSSIVNAAGSGFLVSGGTATVTYGGSLSDSVDTAGPQLLVQITGSTAGVKTFSGALTDSQAGDDGGISLTTNTGTTISFSGGLTISTATAPAFTATGGGTVTVTGTANTLTTTTGTALNVANTNIGAADLIFQSISANGGANGIVLNNTGAAGGLTVTGNGGACNPGTPTCTGGTIQNTTGGDDSGPTPGGTGIVLNNTQQVSLTNMRVRQNTNYAIRGDDVTGFGFANGLVDGVNGTNVSTPFNDGSINLDRVVGSISITGSDISGGFQRNIKIDHPATDASATATITITGNTIHDTSASFGDDGVGIEAENNDNYTINVSNNTFARHGGDHINVSMINNAIVDVTINANTTSGGHPIGLGQGILVFGASWNGTGTYDVTNNTMNGNKQGGAIHMNKGSGTATMSGTISGNTIGTSGVPLSGSEQAFGIIIGSRGAGGSHTALISNNTIRQYFDRGIVVQLGEGNSTLNATVTGNTVDEFGDAVNSLHGLHFDLGILAGDAGAACLDIGGSTAALRNHVTNAANEAAGGVDIRLRRGSLVSLQLRGYTGGSEDDAAVNTYLLGRNDATTVSATSPGTGTTTNTPSGNACPQPT